MTTNKAVRIWRYIRHWTICGLATISPPAHAIHAHPAHLLQVIWDSGGPAPLLFGMIIFDDRTVVTSPTSGKTHTAKLTVREFDSLKSDLASEDIKSVFSQMMSGDDLRQSDMEQVIFSLGNQPTFGYETCSDQPPPGALVRLLV